MAGTPLIELRQVTAVRGGQTLLEDVSFAVREGEIVGLVFVHGTGKSTLLRAAAGFFRPTRGQVLYRGRDVNTFSFKEEIEFQSKTGFVFQNGGLLVNTKVCDNVALPLRYHGDLPEAEIEAKVMEALEQVGMAAAAQRFPYELTIACQKLVTLARALVRGPEIIFFDNFVTGTEMSAWQTMNRVIRQVRAARGVAWLLVMEADPDTYAIADRLCVIEDGRVLEVNAPSAIKQSKNVHVSGLFKTFDFNSLDAG